MKKLLTTACLFVATVVAIVFISPVQVLGQAPTPVPPPEITWGVKIPMRDGVKLHSM